MYKSVLKLKDGLSEDKIKQIKECAEQCFDNRRGKLTNQSTDPNIILHQSDFLWAVTLGAVELSELGFIDCFESWDFVDEYDPRENHSIIESFYRCKELEARW